MINMKKLLNGKKQPKVRFIVIGITLLCLALAGLYTIGLCPNYEVPILTYHRFGYEENTLFVTPENIE